MRGALFAQHLSIAFRHQSADRRLARIGRPSTTTKIGFVWLDGRTRRHTQLLCFSGTSNRTSCSLPSATTSFRATGYPFTTTSTGTVRVAPTRAFSTCQYGLDVYVTRLELPRVGTGAVRIL